MKIFAPFLICAFIFAGVSTACAQIPDDGSELMKTGSQLFGGTEKGHAETPTQTFPTTPVSPIPAFAPSTIPITPELPIIQGSKETAIPSLSGDEGLEVTMPPAPTSLTSTPLPSNVGSPNTSLRDLGTVKQLAPVSELDKELPIHNDPQVTRWLVEAAMSEKEAEKKATGENTNHRLKLYEQIILRTCIPDFAETLSIPKTLPADPACSQTLLKIKAIQKSNPTVACLELGLQSQECTTYTGVQRTSAGPVSDRDSPLYRIMAGTADTSTVKDFRSLQDQVAAAVKPSQTPKTPAELDAIRRYLSVTCREYGLGTEYVPDETNEQMSQDKRSLIQAIQALAKKEVVKTTPAAGRPLRLVRILPQPCYATIQDLKKGNIPMAAAVCYEQGPLAPACINGLIYERKQSFLKPRQNIAPSNTNHQSERQQNADGLQGF